MTRATIEATVVQGVRTGEARTLHHEMNHILGIIARRPLGERATLLRHVDAQVATLQRILEAQRTAWQPLLHTAADDAARADMRSLMASVFLHHTDVPFEWVGLV